MKKLLLVVTLFAAVSQSAFGVVLNRNSQRKANCVASHGRWQAPGKYSQVQFTPYCQCAKGMYFDGRDGCVEQGMLGAVR